MPLASTRTTNGSPISTITRCSFIVFLAAAFSPATFAQAPSCVDDTPHTVSMPPLVYPRISGRYAVQYKLDDTDWADAKVYISVYGGTTASPAYTFSNYPADTSMSFVAIPARPDAHVQLRVTKLWDAPFVRSDHVSVRPTVKGIDADLMHDGTVQISLTTNDDFAGEQFVLWWDRGGEGGAIEGLAFFLNPPYAAPIAGNVDTITGTLDPAADLSGFDTIRFEGKVTIGDSGNRTLPVPPNITTVYFAPGSWVHGKLRFKQDGTGRKRSIYGTGVLDVSRFDYTLRNCDGEQHDSALAFEAPPAFPGIRDEFLIDGITVSDTNRYATDHLDHATVNNVKTLSWNGNNDGLEFGTIARVSNVFVRSGDDSLKMWGAFTVVTNATVWQNYNGGVINLGWFDNSPGENSLIDGVYVVKTDWYQPSTPSFMADPTHSIDHLNNGVVTSQMVPSTNFGLLKPSLYRNIFVEDAPQVLFSLKIFPPRLNDPNLVSDLDLRESSVLNLNIENLFSPPSAANNLIGFDTLPPNYTFFDQKFPDGYTFTGSMHVGLSEVELALPDGRSVELNDDNAFGVGMVRTSGDNVTLDFDHDFRHDRDPQWFSAWTAPQGLEIVPDTPLDNSSVRMIVRPTISGTSVRVKIENNMGDSPVTFSAAYIGQVLSGAAVLPGSNTQLTFGGRPRLTLDPGHGAYSDPLEFPVSAFMRYAVSLDVEKASDISAHELGLVTNYMAMTPHAADPSDAGFSQVPDLRPPPPKAFKGGEFPVYWVAALDVASKSSSGTVVALGDSITDGACSTRTEGGAPAGKVLPDLYNRWTDLLASRLANLPDGHSKAVADEGIAGNEVAGGVDSALLRLGNDVLGREGVTHIIFLEGTNDLATPEHRTAAQLIAADQRIINAVHLIGLKIIGATILPRGGDPTWDSGAEHERRALNDWIRHSGAFDDVIDFDALMQGSTNPANHNFPAIPTNWSCFDGTHPNTAGYAAMAGFIDLNLFHSNGPGDKSGRSGAGTRSSNSVASHSANRQP